jgi:hypothetical protein
MEAASNAAILLKAFDVWVERSRPSCEVASAVLKSLTQALKQVSSAKAQKVRSIGRLIKDADFSRPIVVADLSADVLRF